MVISKEISQIHVLKAIEKMIKIGIESFRASTGYDLLYKGHRYPPKEVLQIASIEAVGREIDYLSGGDHTNNKLIRLGFKIVIKDTDTEIVLDHVRKLRQKNIEQNEKIDLGILIEDLESEEIELYESRVEGALVTYYGRSYERDPINRKNAIDFHGLSCKICGFNFEEVYGGRGKDYIEVHHVKPLSSLGEERVIDPKVDLVTVCSNCHRMIHRKKDNVLTVEELKMLLHSSKKGEL